MILMHKLYHLSFQPKLSGVWFPQLPVGTNTACQYPEPDIPRISLSPSIEDCFRAIYPNVSKYFEEKLYPSMDFYVYEPILTGNEIILTPDMLTDKGHVHDAHMTREHCIINPTYLKCSGQVRIFNTNDSPNIYYRPFNKWNKPRYLAPAIINWVKCDTV